MGLIIKVFPVKGDKKEEKINILFDSGASRSLIRPDVAEELSTPKELLLQREFTAADGLKIISKYFYDLIIEIKGKRIGVEAFLVDNLPVPFIFGALDMEAYMIKLDLAKRQLDLSEFSGSMMAL